MQREQIYDRLHGIFAEVFNTDKIVLSDDLTANDVDNWDSLTHMILINEVEKSFNIAFKLKDLNKMKNVGAMVDIIQSKIEV